MSVPRLLPIVRLAVALGAALLLAGCPGTVEPPERPERIAGLQAGAFYASLQALAATSSAEEWEHHARLIAYLDSESLTEALAIDPRPEVFLQRDIRPPVRIRLHGTEPARLYLLGRADFRRQEAERRARLAAIDARLADLEARLAADNRRLDLLKDLVILPDSVSIHALASGSLPRLSFVLRNETGIALQAARLKVALRSRSDGTLWSEELVDLTFSPTFVPGESRPTERTLTSVPPTPGASGTTPRIEIEAVAAFDATGEPIVRFDRALPAEVRRVREDRDLLLAEIRAVGSMDAYPFLAPPPTPRRP